MQIHLPVHVRIRQHGRRQGQELVKNFISHMYVSVDAHIVVSVSVKNPPPFYLSTFRICFDV